MPERLSAEGTNWRAWKDSQLGDFYLAYGPDSAWGWYELTQLEDTSGRFLALSSREGDGIVLYKTGSDAVFDMEMGQFEALEVGELHRKGATFTDFLRWCKQKDEADRQGPPA